MADLVPEIEESPSQIEKAKKFLCNGCGCSRGSKGVQCSRNFSEETVSKQLSRVDRRRTWLFWPAFKCLQGTNTLEVKEAEALDAIISINLS